MKKLVTDSFYSTETTSSIPGTSSDGSFTVSTAPSGTFGWLIVNFSDSTKREVIEFYDRSGTTIYYRGVNRKSPKTHDPQSPVIISNPSNLFSYFEKITQNTFYYEKKSALVITVWGGIVRTGGSQYTIEDTDITLTDNSINYVYFDTTDQTIKITTTQETAEAQFPLHTIVTLTGAITTETAYNIIDIVPRENASGFIGLDSLSTPANDDILVIYDASDSVYKKITRSDFLQSITEIETFKVRVSAGDTTGGYLEDKLVAGTGITLTKGNAGGDETYTVETSAQTIAEHAYYTPAYLTGGTSIQTTYSTWLVVTDASFRIPVDGVDYNVYVDFTGITNLAGVATKIEEAIQAAVGSAVTCTLETDHFVITSADTTSASDIGFLTTATSTVGTDISGSGWMDCASGSATQTAKVLDPTHDAGRTPVLGDDGLLPVEFMPTNVQEADAFFGATDMTGAEAEELTDESVTTLHAHDFLNLGTSSDGVLFRYTIWGSDFDTKTATSSGCLLDFSSAYARCTSLPNVSQGGYKELRYNTGKDITLEFYVCVYGNASQDGSFGFGYLTTYYDETYANNTIRFVTNGLDLYAVCSSITTAASTATLISTFTAATYSKKKMKIVWTYGTDAKFYVNDSLVATITTNIPSDAGALSVHFIGANGGYQYLLGPVLVTQEI